MLVRVLDTNNAHLPEPRTFPAKGDRAARTVYEQKVYADMGGIFPVMFKISHDDHNAAYPVGEYELAPSSFKINQYDQLELDRYNIRLTPLSKKAG